MLMIDEFVFRYNVIWCSSGAQSKSLIIFFYIKIGICTQTLNCVTISTILMYACTHYCNYTFPYIHRYLFY